MNKEKLEAWCVALESGEFKQGMDTLYDEVTNSYCCLGVLCKINNVPEDAILRNEALFNDGILEDLQKELGLADSLGSVCNYSLAEEILSIEGIDPSYVSVTCLAELNDSGKVPFPVIAKLLRSGAYTK